MWKDAANKGLKTEEYEVALEGLYSRTTESLKAVPGIEKGNLTSIREYAFVLRQILLHHSIKLFEGTINSLIQDNGYLMALSIRGHFETTAALGYLHNRLTSLKQGYLEPETVHEDILAQILGSRDEELLAKRGEDALEAKQILNMFEFADKSISRHIMKGTTNEHKMLMDTYIWLCEFSHPNFHSHTLAFKLNTADQEFEFRHNKPLIEREIKMIENLLISSPIFIELYDQIESLVPNE